MAFVSDYLQIHIAPFLGLVDFAKCLAVDAAAHGVLNGSAAWHELVSAEVPWIDVSPELLRPPRRPRFLRLLAEILKANVAEGFVAGVASIEAAASLAQAAQTTGRGACARGGAASGALGMLRFPIETLAGAMERGGAEGKEDVCRSEAISFVMCEEMADLLHSPCGILTVQFAWKRGSLYVRLRDACSIQGAGRRGDKSRALLVDVSAKHPAYTLAGAGRPWGPPSRRSAAEGPPPTRRSRRASCARCACETASRGRRPRQGPRQSCWRRR